jgi:hypothetical protein
MFRSRKIHFIILVLMLCITAGFGSRASAQGQMLADTGFRPKTDGFAFQNYTNQSVQQNLTPAEMVRMFGDVVCADKNTPCTLIPPAQQIMDEVNKIMNNGHCEGMAALSLVLYAQKEKASQFGGATTPDLKLDNTTLQREIAYFFTTQVTSPTADARVKDKTPNEIVDMLLAAMKDGKNATEYYSIGFWKRGFKEGHAVTPYAISDQGNNIVWIMIYDNNFPGEERHIEVDRKANTWKYSAAASPDIPESLYEGDADSKTLAITPLSVRFQQQVCFFCASSSAKAGGFAAAATAYNQITLLSDSKTNDANILISDASGHKIGYDGDKFVNDFPDAQFIPVMSDDLWSDDPEPFYYIPQGVAFTITVDGSQLKAQEPVDIVMIGAGYDLSVEGIQLDLNQKDTITFSPDGTSISYKSSNAESPDLVLGISHTGADYEFDVKGVEVEAGDTINAKLDYDKGQLLINNTNTKTPSVFDVSVTKIEDTGSTTVSKTGISVDPGKGIFIDFGKMSGTDIPTENE